MEEERKIAIKKSVIFISRFLPAQDNLSFEDGLLVLDIVKEVIKGIGESLLSAEECNSYIEKRLEKLDA